MRLILIAVVIVVGLICCVPVTPVEAGCGRATGRVVLSAVGRVGKAIGRDGRVARRTARQQARAAAFRCN